MDKDTLKRITDLAIDNLKRDRGLTPVLFIEDIDGKLAIVGIETFSPDTKHDVMRRIGKKFAKFKPKAIAFVSEAWYLEAKDKVNVLPPGKAVRDMPDKQECMTITSQDLSGHAYMHMIPFSRVGKDILLGESKEAGIDKDGIEVEANLLMSFWHGVAEGIMDKNHYRGKQ